MPDWDIRREGRAWRGDEAMDRFMMAPEKIEMVGGKILASVEERRTMLALLLEGLGADVAVRMGDPAVWREAIDALEGGGR